MMETSDKVESAAMTLNVDQAKWISIAILTVTVFSCELIPFFLVKKFGLRSNSKTQKYLDLTLRCGGGILLATTFLHLLPEVREALETLIAAGGFPSDSPIQIPELLMCIGFFLMYAVEEVTHKMMAHSHHHLENEKGPLPSEGHTHVVASERTLRGILIVTAISVHQIFEGLAIGLETQVNNVWVLLCAILAHKLILAVCIGTEVASGGAKKSIQAICLGAFGIASSVGVGIGIAISENSNEIIMGTISVTLQGLATGTLLFVVFFEILSKSNHSANSGLAQLTVTFIGFAIMVLLFSLVQD